MKKKTEAQEEQKTVVFRLPETIQFPAVLFDSAKDVQEVLQLITENGFIAIQQKDVIANRIMNTDEISSIREEYGEIAEHDLPEYYEELAELEANFKADKKQLEAKISAANTKFKDLVAFAKRGIKDYPLEMANTLRIPVLNHYLYYTWVNGRFELALVQEIPYHERHDIFNSIEKNKKVFEDMGFTLPEIEIEDTRKNLRRFSAQNTDFEVWEDGDIIKVTKLWVEDFADEDTQEVASIDRREEEKYSLEDYPYKDIDPHFNEQAETPEGTTDEIPGEPEE